MDFTPRTPGGVRHDIEALELLGDAISIHAPRVGCDPAYTSEYERIPSISIHAPRVGCDSKNLSIRPLNIDFNPRTPGGVRPKLTISCKKLKIFQSTHPGWGATASSLAFLIFCAFQSTHPGWGATNRNAARRRAMPISIHAPRVGCDSITISIKDSPRDFNPRTPGGVRLRASQQQTS